MLHDLYVALICLYDFDLYMLLHFHGLLGHLNVHYSYDLLVAIVNSHKIKSDCRYQVGILEQLPKLKLSRLVFATLEVTKQPWQSSH